jgi:ATP-dependent DNA ligase
VPWPASSRELVVEVFYQGIGGQGGLLRQPAFKTIRADKKPVDLATEDSKRKPKSVKRG